MTQRLDSTTPGSELVQLFFRAQDLPEDERRALVARVSDQDPELGMRLAALLAADEDRTDPRFAALRDWFEPDQVVIGESVGEYRIIECLSQGGMATVYAAEHREDPGRRVALKILHPYLLYDRDHAHSLLTEASTARLIEHPGVVEILSSGYLDTGQAYLMMPFLEGESLGQRIRDKGPLPVDQALAIMIELLDIVAAVHERDIVHRDLKPENVMLVLHGESARDRVVLLDFGIAMHLSTTSSCGQARDKVTALDLEHDSPRMVSCAHSSPLGTPLYMAPEQFACPNGVDRCADLYSLGCILYTMISGRPPFIGSIAGVQRGHLYTTPPSLATVSSLPRHLFGVSDLVDELLAKDRRSRPQSAEQARDLLARFQAIAAEHSLEQKPHLGRASRRFYPRALSPGTGLV